MRPALLDDRVKALGEAVTLARGRLPAEPVEAAEEVVERAGRRVNLGLEHTVVALAGPTGAGKSSLFNALAGTGLAGVGHRRPTTAHATAAVWGEGAERLLAWLEVPVSTRIEGGADRLAGLVLIDLPDFDSLVTAHRVEVDRVVGVADLLVWVLDPQKYADAVLHERYLGALSGHAESMMVVLNQADTLTPDALEQCLADLEGLLAADGLRGVELLATSVATGAGVDRLGDALAARVGRREAALRRLSADVTQTAGALDAGCDGSRRAQVTGADRDAAVAAYAEAAGVPIVVAAARRAHLRRGSVAIGWPFWRWIGRLRPDPLRRLHLPDRAAGDQTEAATSLPTPPPATRMRASAAARSLAARATEGLTDPWPELARDAALARHDELPARLDRAVAGTDLRMQRPRWWAVANALQLAVAAIVAAGAVWLVALIALAALRIDDVVPLPELRGVPLPTVFVLGGVVCGLVLTFLLRRVNVVAARRRARRADRALRAAVAPVVDELVVAPVEAELEARTRLCQALAVCRG